MPENETKHNENKDPLKFPKQSLSVVAAGTAEAEPHGNAMYGEAAARLTLHTAVGQRDAEDVANTRWPPPRDHCTLTTAPWERPSGGRSSASPGDGCPGDLLALPAGMGTAGRD